jgi:hypothetical protein
MTDTRGTRIGLGVAAALVIAFLWLPLLLIMVYAFNSSTIQSWPISGFIGSTRPGTIPRRAARSGSRSEWGSWQLRSRS